LLRRSGLAIVQFTEWLGSDGVDWNPQLVIQIGVGQYNEELPVMKEAWPDVEFIGFEPHPGIYRGMVQNYPGQLFPLALGAKVEAKTLYCKVRHKDGSSLFPHANKQVDEKYDEIEVTCSTLDTLFPNGFPGKERILLWLDCEGGELDVLRGGEDFVTRCKMINIEMTSKPPGIGWCKPTDTHRWLNEHGFLRIWHHTQRCAAGQVDAIYTTRDLFKPQYCCCPCQQEMYECGNE